MNYKNTVKSVPVLNTVVDCVKTDPHAEYPTPITPHIFRLSLTRRSEGRAEDDVGEVNYYDLGLKFNCLQNTMIEIVPSEELAKMGYMMPSSYKIFPEASIDEQEPVRIGLYKFREADDLDLPFECLYIYVHQLRNPIFKRNVSEMERELIPGKNQRNNGARGSRVSAKSHYV